MGQGTTIFRTALWVAAALLLFCSAVPCGAEQKPEVDNSKTTQKLKSLPKKGGPKPVVTIYEFRSSVPEIQVKAAQEMFTTALVTSGAVAERQRLAQGVYWEKQMNASGQTTGTSASGKLAGASYIFEVVVS